MTKKTTVAQVIQAHMFQVEDLPLFSGVAPVARVAAFEPTEDGQPRLFEMAVNWEELARRREKIIKPRRK